jgi:hypothetical protein
MPGPMSDSYDPEFGTSDNVDAVDRALRDTAQRITDVIGSAGLRDVVALAQGGPGPSFTATLTEREWRLIRFALVRTAEDL